MISRQRGPTGGREAAPTRLDDPTLAGLAGDTTAGQALTARPERAYWPASVAVLVVFLLAWEYASRTGLVHRIILPAPTEIARAAPELLADPEFWPHVVTTVVEIIAGFLAGSLIGLLLGMALALSPFLRRAYFPLVAAFQATPRVILAPVVLTWLGFGMPSKIAQAIILCFFPVFLNTLVGLSLTEENAVRLMRSLSATRWQTFVKLRLPDALPIIFAGLKVALTFSMIGVLISEFVGAESGLGYLISKYNFEMRIPLVYTMIVLLALIGLGFYLLLDWIDHKLVFWRTT